MRHAPPGPSSTMRREPGGRPLSWSSHFTMPVALTFGRGARRLSVISTLALCRKVGVAFAAAGACNAGAQAAAFSPATDLATSVFVPFAGSAVIDESGTALAIWSTNGAYYSTHRAGGTWSTPAAISSNTVPGTNLVMRTTAAGRATLVSSTSTAIFAADKVASGPWARATTLARASRSSRIENGGANLPFVSNARGDQAVIYQDSLGSASRLMAVRRSAATSAWGSPQVVLSSATAGRFAISAAAIGATGDVVITWESYTHFCGPRSCHDTNYVVHASRAASASNDWRDSGPLTKPDFPYDTQAAIDPQRRAVVFVHPAYSGIVTANTQAGAGAPWSAAANAYHVTGASPALVSADGAPYAFGTLALGSQPASGGLVAFVDGNLAANTWGAPANLASLDASSPTGLLAVGNNGVGGNLAEWTDVDGTVRATSRPAASSAWATPATLAPALSCTLTSPCSVPVAAAINDRGNGVALFVRTNTDDGTVYTLSAVTQ